MKFFEVGKIQTALGIFLSFSILFTAVFRACAHGQTNTRYSNAAAILMPALALGFILYVFLGFYPEVLQQPALLFEFVLMVDLCFLTIATTRDELRPVFGWSGCAVFVLLAIWTVALMSPELVNTALCFFFLFAVLHTVAPIVHEHWVPTAQPARWVHFWPPAALLLIFVPIFKFTDLSVWVWPAVLIIDLLAIALALLTAQMVSILTTGALTVVAVALRLVHLSHYSTFLSSFKNRWKTARSLGWYRPSPFHFTFSLFTTA